MSNSVASGFSSSRVGRNRKFNIDEKYINSPYLSKPIGFSHDKRRRSSNSLKNEQKAAKSPRRRHGDSSDVESVITRGSARSYRTNQTYRRAMPNNAGRMMSMKNFLLPREVDKLLRGFRQKHSNHPILTNRPNSAGLVKDNDDDSTIASDFALSIDDEAMYKQCAEDQQTKEALFSGHLFAAIAVRNSSRQFPGEEIILPPVCPVVAVDNKTGDVSDLESVHSNADNTRKKPTRTQGRKNR